MATTKHVPKQIRSEQLAPSEFDEERIPFDDVMRTLLKAKPQHKPAVRPAKAPTKKK